MDKYGSIFGQILQIFSRLEFYKAVMETKAEKGAKGFSCWDQFVAMIFCQLGQAHSLREICGGLASCLGKLKHLGVAKSPNRSTLSYANEHRPWQFDAGSGLQPEPHLLYFQTHYLRHNTFALSKSGFRSQT